MKHILHKQETPLPNATAKVFLHFIYMRSAHLRLCVLMDFKKLEG